MKRELKYDFLAYCTDYAYGKRRAVPLNQRTVGRYLRGLDLAEKLIGHSLDDMTDNDQIRFLEQITRYKQGTRRVTLQILQRFVHWGIRLGHFTCSNLLADKYDTIIGENVPTSYKYIPPTTASKFLANISNEEHRLMFGLIYFGGLTTSEIPHVVAENVTPTGFFVRRGVSNKVEFIPLPISLANRLYDFAQGKDGPIFEITDSYSGRMKLNAVYKQWQIDNRNLRGTTIRDFRTSGIKAFFHQCNDLKMTKRFAGVPDKKSGWLETLLDISAKDMEKINRARSM